VEFKISPNPGEGLRPLEKIASGGELSRLMLALKTVAGSRRVTGEAGPGGAAPTFVFDEVDAGIGGRRAGFVGRRLLRLSRTAQARRASPPAPPACLGHPPLRADERHLSSG